MKAGRMGLEVGAGRHSTLGKKNNWSKLFCFLCARGNSRILHDIIHPHINPMR